MATTEPPAQSPAQSPIQTPTSRRHSGARVLIDVGVALAQLGVLSSSLVIWFLAGLTFFGEPLGRADYLHMTTGFGVGTLLLLLGFVPARLLGCSSWVWVTGALMAGACLLATGISLAIAVQAPPARFEGEPWWWALELFAWLPMSWPMALLVLGSAALATGRSRPTRR